MVKYGDSGRDGEVEEDVDLSTLKMLEHITAFTLSAAIYVVAKLDIASKLAHGRRSVRELATETGVDVDHLGRIMRTLESYGLFHQGENGDYELRPLGATLVEESSGSARDLALMFMESQYAVFGQLIDAVRTGSPAAESYYGRPYWDWLSANPAQLSQFSKAMAATSTGMLAPFLRDYHLPAGEVVADIGGADGRLLAGFLIDDPTRKGILFDRADVVTAGEKLFSEKGISDRVQIIGGDFFESVPPADVYLLKTILHDWDDERCGEILDNVAAAARRGARLVVIEMIVPPGPVQHLSKRTDLIMMGMHGGKERTETEFRSLLGSAGFQVDRVVHTPGYSVIETTRT